MLHNVEGKSHLTQLTQEQADVASYICSLADSLRRLAKSHNLHFAAYCLEMTRDSAFEVSSMRIALRNKIEAHVAAAAHAQKQAEGN